MVAPPAGTMPPPMAPPGAYAPAPKRPIGVAIIAILSFIAGLFELVGGLGLMGLAAVGAAAVAPGPFVAFVGILGGALVILGIITLGVAVGLWRMRSWAWWFAIIVNVISILISAGIYSWFGVAVSLIIVIYLVVIRDKFGIRGRPAGM